MTATTIFSAKKIITMNPSQPEVSHVAVREGRILGAGDLASLEAWGEYTLDDRFEDKILLPGFVEGHAHTMEGTLWRYVYCGFFDRMDPQGKSWGGLKSIDSVLDRLKDAEAKMVDPEEPLSGWALDPIYMGNRRVTRQDLDSVSSMRPIGVLHASGHILNVNSKALELAGLFKEGINHPGMPLGDDGIPTGELYGPETMTPVGVHVGFNRSLTDSDEKGLRDFGKLCVRTGVTTVTDLAARLEDSGVEAMLRVTGESTFPARVVPLKFFMGATAKETVDRALELKGKATDMCRLGRIKAIADGSIQGFSARMRWPGYHNGAPNGLWYTAPEQLEDLYRIALNANVQVHTHTNGDEATEMVLDTLGSVLKDVPHPDHRFTLQHCQLADAAQFRRMKALDMCVNLFANHHFYWGDEHYRLTVGPERALRMNACRTAIDTGVPMAIHSDAPVTPLGPLFTAWAAVNRITASGRTQGEREKIKVAEALKAITIGAAYTLHMDDEVGSIEVGKKADFAVLEDDPTQMSVEAIKDARVWGTVQGGRVFPAASL
ncbi:MAG TPA: amidohydrolase [Rhodobacteraceae bacterium]|nr:amidohydrolase [Amylibacter sp.]MDG2000035.1 amidohydrolase [Amylibacter sp.]HAD27134.1 amidohydrolase [Paracoccaceae bacterium]